MEHETKFGSVQGPALGYASTCAHSIFGVICQIVCLPLVMVPVKCCRAQPNVGVSSMHCQSHLY